MGNQPGLVQWESNLDWFNGNPTLTGSVRIQPGLVRWNPNWIGSMGSNLDWFNRNPTWTGSKEGAAELDNTANVKRDSSGLMTVSNGF